MPKLRSARRISLLILSALLCCALSQAQQRTFTLDPAQTKINFTVDSTLHAVHGDFRLKRGSIQFDSTTGQAGGDLVVDATSGESGNSGRDRKMHKDILESPKYSDIVFTPQHIKGAVAAEGKSQIEAEGQLTMHGRSMPVTLPLQVQLQGGAGTADGSFTIKYQEWGLKSPSTFILRVSDKVEIHVHAVGRMVAAAGN
jgi:polyisoprenoid-binding protein YceI